MPDTPTTLSPSASPSSSAPSPTNLCGPREGNLSVVQTSGYVLNAEGWIAWRVGTGGNVELTNLRVHEPGKGCATRLLRAMLAELRKSPPYCTVYGFTRTANHGAQGFYAAVGFELSRVHGVYADGDAMVFSARYYDLCRIHSIEESK